MIGLAKSERRTTNTAEWLNATCTEFSDATGWDLKFIPARDDDVPGFDRRELDWCWHTEISDGEQRYGAIHLDVPGLSTPALTFDSAYRLAELCASHVNQILAHKRTLAKQTSEIGALVNCVDTPEDGFRRRIHAIMRASVAIPNFLAAALFILDPDGTSINLRMSHEIDDNQIRAKKRLLGSASFDLQALQSGFSQINKADDTEAAMFLPEDMSVGICVGVENDAGPVGTLWLYDRRVHIPDSEEMELLRGFARQIADVFERLVLLRENETTHRLSRELDFIATTTAECDDVHESIPGCDVAVRSRSRHEVGGDLCEFLRIDDHRTVFVVGDASGDSIPAAMVMTATRGAIHSYLESIHPDVPNPDALVMTVNRALLRITACQQFISMIVGVLDGRDGSLVYTNAGHPPALHIRGNDIRTLTSQGMLLGVVDGAEYSTARLMLQPDDLLILFSDGITEARNRTQKMFRDDGIVAALNGDASGSATEVLETIWSRYEAHTDGRNLDDRTLVVMKAIKASVSASNGK